jgi:hypothetical protein
MDMLHPLCYCYLHFLIPAVGRQNVWFITSDLSDFAYELVKYTNSRVLIVNKSNILYN